MTRNNRNFVIQRYKNHGVNAKWRVNSEGGRCICPNLLRKIPHTCKFHFTFSYSFICTCQVPFQRPVVGTDTHTKHTTKSQAGLRKRGESLRRSLCALTSRYNGNFWSLGTWSPSPHSLYFAAYDIFLCYRIKSQLRGRRFQDVPQNREQSQTN
jgi:hypothetical protein